VPKWRGLFNRNKNWLGFNEIFGLSFLYKIVILSEFIMIAKASLDSAVEESPLG
jgi:hypothetical protein